MLDNFTATSISLISTIAILIVVYFVFNIVSQLGFPSIGKTNPGNLRKITFFDHFLYNFNIRNRRWRIPQLCEYISKKYGKVVELELLGQRVIVITDHKIANSFMAKHTKHLRQRFGNEEGLKKLNMQNNGLIWNNDVLNWKNNRIIFEATLNNGVKMLDQLSTEYFKSSFAPSIKLAQPNSLLNFLRNYTVTMTMEGLFGLDCCKNPNWRDKAKDTVANYFKAWEFFLLTPETKRFNDETVHERYCEEMVALSKDIFNRSNSNGKPSKFIEDLSEHNTDNQIRQCISEMLLAGTDTSSLTMFYTTLFLADNPEIGNQLAKKFQIDDTNIAKLYYESMRLVAVGPVILRQAEMDCELETNDELQIVLRKGDGIIFNIAGMNLDSSTFPEPKSFNPSRYTETGESYPLTFGIGKKSCVGKNFAEKEMKLFFSWFIQNYVLLGNEKSMIDLLQTRWDIANAPLSDLRMYVFPRMLVHLLGNQSLVSGVAHELKQLLPKLKVVDCKNLRGNDLGKDFELLNQEFAIVYGIPIEEYPIRSYSKNHLVVSLFDENEKFSTDDKNIGATCLTMKSGENSKNAQKLFDIISLHTKV